MLRTWTRRAWTGCRYDSGKAPSLGPGANWAVILSQIVRGGGGFRRQATLQNASPRPCACAGQHGGVRRGPRPVEGHDADRDREAVTAAVATAERENDIRRPCRGHRPAEKPSRGPRACCRARDAGWSTPRGRPWSGPRGTLHFLRGDAPRRLRASRPCPGPISCRDRPRRNWHGLRTSYLIVLPRQAPDLDRIHGGVLVSDGDRSMSQVMPRSKGPRPQRAPYWSCARAPLGRIVNATVVDLDTRPGGPGGRERRPRASAPAAQPLAGAAPEPTLAGTAGINPGLPGEGAPTSTRQRSGTRSP